jgi:hypothetical protein
MNGLLGASVDATRAAVHPIRSSDPLSAGRSLEFSGADNLLVK